MGMMKYIRLFEQKAQPHYEYYPDGRVKQERWRLNGQMHREDGPAWTWYYPDGRVKEEQWWLNDRLRREDGPAWIEYYPDGRVKEEQWWLNGQMHREDGPAQIKYYPDGQVELEVWRLNGQWHREDGPAWIEYWPDGRVKEEQWWLDDNEYSQAEHEARSPATPIDRLDSIAAGDDSRLAELAKENLKGRDFTGWVFNDTWE